MATDDPSSSPPSDEDLTRSRPAVLGTRALLDALAAGDGDDSLTLASILAGLSRQVFGMLNAQQRPFRTAGDERQKKAAFIRIQTALQFMHHSLARRQQLR